jgi:hypothetical protein
LMEMLVVQRIWMPAILIIEHVLVAIADECIRGR